MRMRVEPARRAPDCGAYHSCSRCPASCQEPLGRSAGDPPFLVFLVTVVLSLLRARRPARASSSRRRSTSRSAGRPRAARDRACSPLRGSAARDRCRRRWLLAAAAAFARAASSSPRSRTAPTRSPRPAKLVELGALDARRGRVPRHARAACARCSSLVVAFASSRSAGALVGFVHGGRRPSGLVPRRARPRRARDARRSSSGSRVVHARRGRPGPLALAGIVAGGLGDRRSARRSRACSASTSPSVVADRARAGAAALRAGRAALVDARGRRSSSTAGTLALRQRRARLPPGVVRPAAGDSPASTRRAGASG